MRVRPADPAHQAKHGYDYMMAVDRTEWVALLTAVEVVKEDLERTFIAGHVMTPNQIAILAMYTDLHRTMEESRRVCPDLPIQDETIQAPEGGGTVRVQPVPRGKWRGISLRSPNRKDQDDD